MDVRLRRWAAGQGGVFTRRQCYAVGLDDVDLERLLARDGPFVVVRRGVYAARDTWDVADAATRVRMHDVAAHLVMEVPHLMSHDSAARALGVPMLRPQRELVHVTREGLGGTRTKAGVKHHLTRIDLPDARTVGPLPVTGPARTGLDLAREHGLVAGKVALDHALRHGVRRADLERELAVMRSWPQVRTARAAAHAADGRIESAAESLTHLLLLELGYEPDLQWPVSCAGQVFWTDFRVGCHVVEVEGVGKLLPRSEGGLANRSTREVLRARENRDRLVRGEGLGTSWVGWDDLFGARREHTGRWLVREVELSAQRYGWVLPPHLAERAALIRRRTPRRLPA